METTRTTQIALALEWCSSEIVRERVHMSHIPAMLTIRGLHLFEEIR